MIRILPVLLLAVWVVGCTGLRSKRSPSFAAAERTMILAADSSRPMRVFQITNPSDSLLLRQRSLPVQADPHDPLLAHFIQRLYRTVRDPNSLGVGIAAPQVGILRQIIWVQRFDKEGFPFEVYLNPEIRQYSDLKQPCLEGCLSIPDRRDTTRNRAYAILLEYDRPSGEHAVEMVEDFTAVIFQHEIDHLNGILYTDHLQEEIEQAQEREARDR
ncbi:MAG: peptide deformylase [Bacteroidetes bacterium]|nr:MAG: peptide deformylase [Bacteroidota bacterium]